MTEDFTQLLARVRAHLAQDHRYAHSVRVARCAEVIAAQHGIDARKARLAGLLHDLARLYSPTRLIAECEARAMPIDAIERSHPVLLHARLGAALAREDFGVEDGEVLSAIEKHTTAAATMSPLDCAVYLADSLEPGRDFPERAGLCRLAKRDLDEAMRGVLLATLEHNARHSRPSAPATLAAARSFGLEVRASAS